MLRFYYEIWQKIQSETESEFEHMICQSPQNLVILKKKNSFRGTLTYTMVLKYLSVKFSSWSSKGKYYIIIFFFKVENIKVTCKRGFNEYLTHLLFQDKLLFFQWPYWGLNIKMNFYRCSNHILGWILGDIN